MSSHDPRIRSIAEAAVRLADEIDGVADFGVTICLISESRMSGRADHLRRREQGVRDAAQALADALNLLPGANQARVSSLQADLEEAVRGFLMGFASLERFPLLSADSAQQGANDLRHGWERLRGAIREIAALCGDREATWYADILGREDSYRDRLHALSDGARDLVPS